MGLVSPSCALWRREALSSVQHGAMALMRLAESLGDDFDSAVQLLSSCGGKAILTGVGKSGHVARKVASTLSSLGTPSFFMHPVEASHGDLGMLTTQDVLVAFSNSGETEELFPTLQYAARRGVPSVGVTRVATSTLATLSTVPLVLPQVREACPLGLAPTTSTTMMMALGDALAIALFTLRGFSLAQYRDLHPGGSLGRKLKRVRDVMRKDMPLVQKGILMDAAILEMTAKGMGIVGILEGARLVGVISDGDLRRHMKADLLSQRVEDVMSLSPVTISGESLVEEALHVMNTKKITALFVVHEGVPLGILHLHDCVGMVVSS